MDANSLSARYEDNPLAASAATSLLIPASQADRRETLLAAALPLLAEAAGARAAALMEPRRGRWRKLAASPEGAAPPESLLAEVLDRERPVEEQGWVAAPLDPRSPRRRVLALESPTRPSEQAALATADALAAALAVALASVEIRYAANRRVRRLEAILSIAAQWNQHQEMNSLLEQMAAASTDLLGAERASIFLWDKPNQTLVGRPALGVEDNELRIPDDKGVVGQVVQTGEPRRVDAGVGAEQREIDRRVDEELGFTTRNLLCVPLRSRGGELFGAFELINKTEGDFTDEDQAALTELAAHAAIALENTQELEQLLTVRKQLAADAAEEVRMIGESPAIEALRSTVRRVADTELAILILGENGTGKEVVSQMIHYLSRRRDEPFVAVNCAAIAETLLESELFGHEKGAFTDAHESRAGKFELASGGTLFLDEIGDLSLSGQAKLLRVLEEKIVVRVGGSTPIHTDARVLAATNQNLAEMVRAKKFREDLYFRLNVVTLELPPLRERGEDIILLAEHFLKNFCRDARRKPPKLSAAAKKRLVAHPWPGNVRELRNLMERLAYLSAEDKVDADDLEFILSPGGERPGAVPLNMHLTEATAKFQTDYIKKHIDSARGNMSEAAKRMGLHRSNLYRKMKQLGMTTQEDDEEE